MRSIALAPVLLLVVAATAATSLAGHPSPTTERVSVNSQGAQGNAASFTASISGSGRFVAFNSSASNLAGKDENDQVDVFRRDRGNGRTRLVSVGPTGKSGKYQSANPSISASGRFVAFESNATDLVAGDANGIDTDVFVRDLKRGRTRLISISSHGKQDDGSSYAAAISANGRYVAFESGADDLVGHDTNGAGDVFVRDRSTATTRRVSVDSRGGQLNGYSLLPSISADGRFVAFGSVARKLTGDPYGRAQVFVRDRKTGTTRRASVSSSGAPANSASYGVISANGRFVAFESTATNLVGADTNGMSDVFVHDRRTGKTKRVSVRPKGDQMSRASLDPSISADGRMVAFDTVRNGFVETACDVFVRDRKTRTTRQVDVRPDGSAGPRDNCQRGVPAVSLDGRFVAFGSLDEKLVHGSGNGAADVFVRGPLRP